MKLLKPILVAVCLGLWFGAAVPALAAETTAAPQTAERARALVVGVVTSDPKKQLPKLQAMADYLAARLGDRGIERGAIVAAANNEEMIRLLRTGAVDLFSATAFSAIQFAAEAGAEILLREWKKGVAEYHTVFIARRDSGIASLADLRGRKIGFEDPNSTTGFLLPLAMLRLEGLTAVEIPPNGHPASGTIGYAFADEEVNIAVWVARGIVDAGAISDQDWEDVQRTPDPIKQDLVIFHASEPLFRSSILARGGLDQGLKAGLKDILAAMHTDAAGQEALKAYYGVAKYDELAGLGRRGLDMVRRLYPLVVAEIR